MDDHYLACAEFPDLEPKPKRRRTKKVPRYTIDEAIRCGLPWPPRPMTLAQRKEKAFLNSLANARDLVGPILGSRRFDQTNVHDVIRSVLAVQYYLEAKFTRGPQSQTLNSLHHSMPSFGHPKVAR